MGFIKVGVVLFASLLVGMANASNGNKNNNNKTENTEVNKLYNNYLNKQRINSLLHTTYSPK